MTKQQLATSWRKVLFTTVATSILLGGCSWAQDTFSRDSNDGQQARIEGNMRRPVGNVSTGAGAEYAGSEEGDSRRPANNPGGAIGAPTVDVSTPEHATPAPMSSNSPSPSAKRNSKGFFSFLYRDDAQHADAAAPTMERRVPQGNQNPDAAPVMADGAASFEAAVPVAGVEESQLAEMNADYPDLANVPQAPQGVDPSVRKDALTADLSNARNESQNQQVALNAQVAADGPFDGVAPAPQTAPVAFDGAPAAAAQAPASDADLQAEFASIVAAPAGAPATPQVASGEQPVIMGSPPRPLDTQIAMADTNAAPAPQIAPQTGGEEWVDVGGELTNQAVPVDGVAVSPAAEPIGVSPIPVAPTWNGNSMATATGGIRTLPESRYAGRRQALATQRYARHTGSY